MSLPSVPVMGVVRGRREGARALWLVYELTV